MYPYLIKLKGLIQTYTTYNIQEITEQEITEIVNDVEQLVQLIKWEVHETLPVLPEEGKLFRIREIQQYLMHFAEGITDFDKSDQRTGQLNWILAKVQSELYSLLKYLFTYFPSYFDAEAVLPTYFLDWYQKTWNNNHDKFRKKLNDLSVDPELSALIINLNAANTHSERFKLKTWRQWNYTRRLLQSLEDFLEMPETENINLGILKLLVSREFNSIQLYAFVIRYIENITLGDSSLPEQRQELLLLMKTFRQVRIDSEELYDPQNQSIKLSIIESIEAEAIYLEEKEKAYLQSFKATNPENPSKFYFKVAITLAELMFFFRVMLEVQVISTKFNSYLYEFIANHIRTERAEGISKKSMRNHFSNKPFPDRTVLTVRTWLHKMISHIDVYYKTS